MMEEIDRVPELGSCGAVLSALPLPMVVTVEVHGSFRSKQQQAIVSENQCCVKLLAPTALHLQDHNRFVEFLFLIGKSSDALALAFVGRFR